MPGIMLDAMVDGAVWLGVGMTILLIGLLALSGWLYLRTQRPEPVPIRLASGPASPRTFAARLEDPEVQARIHALQQQFRRGEIEQADYEAELAKIRRDLAA